MAAGGPLERKDALAYGVVITILGGIALAGLLADGPLTALRGLLQIQVHPARLLTDYSSVAGDGAAMLNASLVAGIGLALVRINGVRLSGPTVAAVFTLLGFGLFGKTPVNVVPIILGTYLAALAVGKRFRDYILIALFGTALGPVVMLIAAELSLAPLVAWPVAILGGVAAGFLLPAVAMVMLRLHQGYSLYNIGVTTGFLALFAAAVIFGRGSQFAADLFWNDDPSTVLQLLVPVASAVLLVVGLSHGPRVAAVGLWSLMQQPGRLPSDFMDSNGLAPSLVNMGIMGLLAWGYTVVVGAPLNGPVLGGILTIMGFAAFGKHPWNVWPVVAGVVVAALLFGHDPAAPGVILAALFCTTLAPLAGSFGAHVGFIAGFLHLLLVQRTGSWHAGIGLYNNGFAGGLTATLLVAVFEWREMNRPERVVTRQGSYRRPEENEE